MTGHWNNKNSKWQHWHVMFNNGAHLTLGAVSAKQAVWQAYNKFGIRSEFRVADVFTLETFEERCKECDQKVCPYESGKIGGLPSGNKTCMYFAHGGYINDFQKNIDLLQTMKK